MFMAKILMLHEIILVFFLLTDVLPVCCKKKLRGYRTAVAHGFGRWQVIIGGDRQGDMESQIWSTQLSVLSNTGFQNVGGLDSVSAVAVEMQVKMT